MEGDGCEEFGQDAGIVAGVRGRISGSLGVHHNRTKLLNTNGLQSADGEQAVVDRTKAVGGSDDNAAGQPPQHVGPSVVLPKGNQESAGAFDEKKLESWSDGLGDLAGVFQNLPQRNLAALLACGYDRSEGVGEVEWVN